MARDLFMLSVRFGCPVSAAADLVPLAATAFEGSSLFPAGTVWAGLGTFGRFK